MTCAHGLRGQGGLNIADARQRRGLCPADTRTGAGSAHPPCGEEAPPGPCPPLRAGRGCREWRTAARSSGWCVALTLLLSFLSDPLHASGPRPSKVGPLPTSDQLRSQAAEALAFGKLAFEARDYAAALEAFETALGLSSLPEARWYRARCLRQLQRTSEAFTELGRAELEALQAAELDHGATRIAQLAAEERQQLQRQLLGRAESAPGKTKSPAGQPRVTPPALRARPSTPVALATEPASARSVTAAPPPPVSSEQFQRPLAYAAAGISAVGFGTFAAFGILSKHTYADWLAACPGAPQQPQHCSPEAQTTLQKGENQRLWSNLGLALGAVGLGGAALLYLTEPGPRELPTTLSVDWSVSKIGLSVKGGL